PACLTHYPYTTLFRTLDAFDQCLVKEGYRIYKTRSKFVKYIEEYASKFQRALTNGAEKLEIDYIPDIKAKSLEDYHKEFIKKRKDRKSTRLNSSHVSI